jgi:hypothetical protein
MASGCLFGCGSGVMAADVIEPAGAANTIEAGESCHAARAHDCCSTKKPKKQVARRPLRQPEGVSSFVPVPRGSMKDCPLVMNATAVTAKNTTTVADPGSSPVAMLPRLEEQAQPLSHISVVQFLPNRGPTHLRCCVFLI